MLLLPYKKLVVYSSASRETVSEILRQVVEPYVGFRFDRYSKSAKPYVGKVGEKTFSIRPIFSGRNSFIPRIVGTIDNAEKGSRVTLTFRLHYVVIVALLWIIGFIIFSVLKYGETSALLFVLLIFVMTVGFFNYEYRKTKCVLLEILKADANAALSELGRKLTTEAQANA
jgi:hypothetical protein